MGILAFTCVLLIPLMKTHSQPLVTVRFFAHSGVTSAHTRKIQTTSTQRGSDNGIGMSRRKEQKIKWGHTLETQITIDFPPRRQAAERERERTQGTVTDVCCRAVLLLPQKMCATTGNVSNLRATRKLAPHSRLCRAVLQDQNESLPGEVVDAVLFLFSHLFCQDVSVSELENIISLLIMTALENPVLWVFGGFLYSPDMIISVWGLNWSHVVHIHTKPHLWRERLFSVPLIPEKLVSMAIERVGMVIVSLTRRLSMTMSHDFFSLFLSPAVSNSLVGGKKKEPEKSNKCLKDSFQQNISSFQMSAALKGIVKDSAARLLPPFYL